MVVRTQATEASDPDRNTIPDTKVLAGGKAGQERWEMIASKLGIQKEGSQHWPWLVHTSEGHSLGS